MKRMNKKQINKEEKNSIRKYSDRELFKRLLPYMYLKKTLLVTLLMLMLFDLVYSVLSPYFYSLAMDTHIANKDFRKLLYLAFLMILLEFFQGINNFLQVWWFGSIREEALYELRKDMFNKMQEMDLQYYDNHSMGDVIARITSDVNSLGAVVSGEFLFLFIAAGMLIIKTIVMLQTNALLTITTIFMIIPIISVLFYNKFVVRKKNKAFRDSNSKMTSQMTENLLGIKVSRNFARKQKNLEDFEKINDENMQTAFAFFKSNSKTIAWKETYQSLAYIFIIFMAGFLIFTNQGNLSVGIIFLFVLYLNGFYGPIVQITNYFSALQTGYASFERICTFMDEPVRIPNDNLLPKLKLKESRIKFQDISFAYNPENGNVLENFNLDINPGETLAIVGDTGSGKTTIFNILTRLYPVNEGDVLIDDQSINQVNLQSLRTQIGVVLQEPYLFQGSIRDNLSITKEVSENQINKALKYVGADFVKRLKNGIDTIIGSTGTRLSQGQKQLISFARAIVNNPPILLMDEATSSIDPQSELILQKSLNKLLKNRTAIIIAHRLSTVKNADRIVVLQNGKIVEQGSFQQLLERKGKFHHLYSLQFAETLA